MNRMKRTLLLLCIFLFILTCTRQVVRPQPPALKPLEISRREFERGMWVRGVSVASPDSISRIISVAQRLGITDIYVQAVVGGYAYYNSQLLPRSQYLSEISDPDYDPLAALIRAAHQKSIRVHAWVNALLVWSLKDPPDSLRHVVYTHPEWFISDVNKRSLLNFTHEEWNGIKLEGLYLDPAQQEVQTYLASICAEIVTYYPVASIHLDFIRYPGASWGLPEYDRAALFAGNRMTLQWMELTRYPQLPLEQRWRTWQFWKLNEHRENILFETVYQVRQAIKSSAMDPHCALTAAVFANPGMARYQFGQNWMSWQDVVDYPVIMSYTQDVELFAAYVQHALTHRRDAVFGIGFLWPDMEAEAYYEVAYLRKKNCAGVVFFDFTALDTLVDFERFSHAHTVPYDSLLKDRDRYSRVNSVFEDENTALAEQGSVLLIPGEELAFCAFLLSLSTDAQRDLARMDLNQWEFLERLHDDVAAFKYLDALVFPLGDTLVEPPYRDITYTFTEHAHSSSMTQKSVNTDHAENHMRIYENAADPLVQTVYKTPIGKPETYERPQGTYSFVVTRVSAGGRRVARNNIEPNVLPLFLNYTIQKKVTSILPE